MATIESITIESIANYGSREFIHNGHKLIVEWEVVLPTNPRLPHHKHNMSIMNEGKKLNWENLEPVICPTFTYSMLLYVKSGYKWRDDCLARMLMNDFAPKGALQELSKQVNEACYDWHNNELQAGTKRQSDFVSSLPEELQGYNPACNELMKAGLYEDKSLGLYEHKKGVFKYYAYGERWLVKPMSQDDIDKIKQCLVDAFNQFYKSTI